MYAAARQKLMLAFLGLASALCVSTQMRAQVYNLKVVTDAFPDYSDMESMIHSIAGKWHTPGEKVWAMFYWNHIARRQTAPMKLHGLAVTDPIRQFNDYGYTMCSTKARLRIGWKCSRRPTARTTPREAS